MNDYYKKAFLYFQLYFYWFFLFNAWCAVLPEDEHYWIFFKTIASFATKRTKRVLFIMLNGQQSVLKKKWNWWSFWKDKTSDVRNYMKNGTSTWTCLYRMWKYWKLNKLLWILEKALFQFLCNNFLYLL